jgi:hypothetical protein
MAAIFLFALVLNPELRALLLVMDYLGADLVLLLLGGYISHYWPTISCYLRLTIAFIAAGANSILKSLRWMGYGLLPREAQWAQIDHIGLASGVFGRVALERLRS